MIKLSPIQNKAIEEYWMNINDYRKQLKYREWELLESKTTDTNIGGGKSNKISNPTEQKAIILSEDEHYRHLKNVVQAVDRVYNDLDEDSKTIVEMRYWCDDVYEWEDIAFELGFSRSKVLRKRNRIIDKTAERLGLVSS